MGRGKKVPNVIDIDELKIENKVEIDYDKLAQAIVKAKQIEKQNEEREKAKALAEWRETIGYKEHDDKNGLHRAIFRVCNRIKAVCKIMFISKKKHIETSPTTALAQEFLVRFFRFIQWLLVLLTGGFVAFLFYHPDVECVVFYCIMAGVLAIISFMFSRIFRLMAIEVDQMSNREQVLSVFTAVVAVVPLIESIIDLLREVS